MMVFDLQNFQLHKTPPLCLGSERGSKKAASALHRAHVAVSAASGAPWESYLHPAQPHPCQGPVHGHIPGWALRDGCSLGMDDTGDF